MPHMSSADSFIEFYPLNTSFMYNSKEKTQGCRPYGKNCKEKATFETEKQKEKVRVGKETQTLDNR